MYIRDCAYLYVTINMYEVLYIGKEKMAQRMFSELFPPFKCTQEIAVHVLPRSPGSDPAGLCEVYVDGQGLGWAL